ncbi:MAG: DNA recombination protein RmuC [Bacteroidetes bacterium]|nr:DNA recombination protein RmuC [Bacteroidota bacterium]
MQALDEKLVEKQFENDKLTETVKEKSNEQIDSNGKLSTSDANLQAALQTINEKSLEIVELKEVISSKTEENFNNSQALATAIANNTALGDKLETQKTEIEELGKKFNLEFENIANKILETKSEKFTELNKFNIKTILEPLGNNIDEFKRTVNETYDKESKERFSLGEKVKELALLNKVISDEARNLTKALKGESKTQGRWGEMILESILEKSGLRKDEEYFIEHQLIDAEGNALRSDFENKKMRPDAVIKYPDKRSIIIDSKVSLNAFTRFSSSTDLEEQKTELAAHVRAVKNHIVALSTKGYDDYDKSLDFVMMFIPSEPAYMAALQGDPELWNFAYDKRILLINPTNLIVSLKLIVDLWKRENQNRNAQEIAARGAKLYDKFVSFVENLEDVGKFLDKSKEAYNHSYKQLSTGKDNLVLQSTKLKNLGLKNKKKLSPELLGNSETNLISE